MQKNSAANNPSANRSTKSPAKPNARRQAAAMLAAIERGKTLDEATDRLDMLSTADRGLARAMVMLALRHRGEIAALLTRHMKRAIPPRPHLAKSLLHLGVVQICLMDVPDHAAVSETVKACGRREQPYRGLINAILRKLSAETKTECTLPDDPALNMPDWMMAQWTEAYGPETAARIAATHRRRPPLDLCFKTPGQAAAWLEQNPTGAVRLGLTHIRLAEAGRVETLQGFEAGDWWVQDIAAGLPAQMLLARLPDTPCSILDLCAAPGGKTLQLAAAGHDITALDVSESRLKRLSENLSRTGLTATLVTADALDWKPDQAFDAILLDAPCSATGTIRRHPDLPLHRRPGYTAKLTVLQDALLNRAATWLKPGGLLLYATCSLDPEEGEKRVAGFLNTHETMRAEMLPPLPFAQNFITAHELRTTPADLHETGAMDGFYAALMQRKA